MKKIQSTLLKPLILLIFLLLMSFSGFAQSNQKSSYQIKVASNNAKSVQGDMVLYKFFILNISDTGDAESLKNLISKQDGVKKVELAPLSAEKTAFCVLTVSKGFKLELVQNMLERVGVEKAIVDDVTIPIDKLADHFSNIKKQKNQTK